MISVVLLQLCGTSTNQNNTFCVNPRPPSAKIFCLSVAIEAQSIFTEKNIIIVCVCVAIELWMPVHLIYNVTLSAEGVLQIEISPLNQIFK